MRIGSEEYRNYMKQKHHTSEKTWYIFAERNGKIAPKHCSFNDALNTVIMGHKLLLLINRGAGENYRPLIDNIKLPA